MTKVKPEPGKYKYSWGQYQRIKDFLAKKEMYSKSGEVKVYKDGQLIRVEKPDLYKDHLKSQWYIKRRNKLVKQRGHRCEVCGSTKFLNLHHTNYGVLGAEFFGDNIKTLKVLCRECHKKEHGVGA